MMNAISKLSYRTHARATSSYLHLKVNTGKAWWVKAPCTIYVSIITYTGFFRKTETRERERRARCERGTEIQSARNHVTGFPFATIETLRGRSIRGSSYLFDPCSRIFLLSKYLYHFFSCYLRTRSSFCVCFPNHVFNLESLTLSDRQIDCTRKKRRGSLKKI